MSSLWETISAYLPFVNKTNNSQTYVVSFIGCFAALQVTGTLLLHILNSLEQLEQWDWMVSMEVVSVSVTNIQKEMNWHDLDQTWEFLHCQNCATVNERHTPQSHCCIAAHNRRQNDFNEMCLFVTIVCKHNDNANGKSEKMFVWLQPDLALHNVRRVVCAVPALLVRDNTRAGWSQVNWC